MKVSAQAAGEVCNYLEEQGRLTPRDLVQESKRKDAPLHDAFEWDDTQAAQLYRETQARHIICSVEVVYSKAKTEENEQKDISIPTRAFVSIKKDTKKREYHSIDRVIKNKDYTSILLDQALNELRTFKSKYSQLSQLAEVFGVIDSLISSAA